MVAHLLYFCSPSPSADLVFTSTMRETDQVAFHAFYMTFFVERKRSDNVVCVCLNMWVEYVFKWFPCITSQYWSAEISYGIFCLLLHYKLWKQSTFKCLNIFKGSVGDEAMLHLMAHVVLMFLLVCFIYFLFLQITS